MAELLAMAMAYRNWSQRELAEFIGRDVHNLIPPSGIPRIDVVVRLAAALDWPKAAVLEDICGDHGRPLVSDLYSGPSDFAALNKAAYAACMNGDFARSVELAIRASQVASSPEELAEADRRESVAWDYLGRFQNSIEAGQRGLRRPGVSAQLRLELRANLASCYFALGQVHEAEGLASSVLVELDWQRVTPDLRKALEAHLMYVRAQCRLHRVDSEPDLVRELGTSAEVDFRESSDRWNDLASRLNQPAWRGRSHICHGGLLALEAVLERRSALDVLDDFLTGLDSAVDIGQIPKGDLLEGFGWWAVFGASVALRSDLPSAERSRYLAVFGNKAYDIAERLGNWSLRERAFTIDFLRSRGDSVDGEVVLDDEDVRTLSGTMGRFPVFRPMGWEIYRRAQRV